jgi:hypothetical protein
MYNQNREAKALLSRLKTIAFMCEHYEKTKENRRFEKKKIQTDRMNGINGFSRQ